MLRHRRFFANYRVVAARLQLPVFPARAATRVEPRSVPGLCPGACEIAWVPVFVPSLSAAGLANETRLVGCLSESAFLKKHIDFERGLAAENTQ